MAESILMRLIDPKSLNIDYSMWDYYIEPPYAVIYGYMDEEEKNVEVPKTIKGYQTALTD